MAVREGDLTLLHDGVTAAGFLRHVELQPDSCLSIFVDGRTNKLLETVRLFDKMAIVLPSELASAAGPWTAGVDAQCRFQIVLTAERDLFFEAASPADAAAWVAAIQKTLDTVVEQRVSAAKTAFGADAVVKALAELELAKNVSKQALAVGDLRHFSNPVITAHAPAGVAPPLLFALAAAALARAADVEVAQVLVHKDDIAKVGVLARALTAREHHVLGQLAAANPGDVEALRCAQELSAYAFYAMRVPHAMAGKHSVSGVATLFGGGITSSAAMAVAQTVLRSTLLTASFLGTVPKGDRVDVDTSGLPTDPVIVRALGSAAAADALAFWVKNSFPASVGIAELLARLQLDAQARGVVPEHLRSTPFTDLEALYRFFAGNKDVETTTVQRFAAFLKVRASGSVAAAVEPYLLGQADPVPMPTDKGRRTSSATPATPTTPPTVDGALSPRVNRRSSVFQGTAGVSGAIASSPEKRASLAAVGGLGASATGTLTGGEEKRRRTLRPVDYGTELARLQASFLEGTRAWLFAEMEQWALLGTNASARRVFWLQADAGFGKSVIAAQLVLRYGEKRLKDTALYVAGHVFVKHNDQSRSDAHRVLATLAFRLAAQVPEIARVYDALLEDPAKAADFAAYAQGDFKGKTLEDVYDQLFFLPLRTALSDAPSCAETDLMLVLDGLDELAPGPARDALLSLFANKVRTLPAVVRWIVLARPDADLVEALAGLSPTVFSRHDLAQRTDLGVFFKREVVALTSLAQRTPHDQDKIVAFLQDAAAGHFLAARLMATAVRQRDAAAAGAVLALADLEALLPVRGGEYVDRVYRMALDRVEARLGALAAGDAALATDLRGTLRQTLNTILACAVPPRLGALFELCGGADRPQSEPATRGFLRALAHLFLPGDDRSPIEPIHKSVFDFLRDPARAGPHAVDLAAGHAVLARSTLRLLRDAHWPSAMQVDAVGPHVYAREFAAVHLAHCATNANNAKDCKTAEAAWFGVAAPHDKGALAPLEVTDRMPAPAAGALLHQCGETLERLGALPLAAAYFERAVTMRPAAQAARDRALSLTALASVCSAIQAYPRAESALEEATKILSGMGDAKSLAVARLWATVALVYRNKNSHNRALELYNKALIIQLTTLGDKHPETAQTFNDIAAVFENKGDMDRALEFYNKALAIRMGALGGKDASTAKIYASMAATYQNKGDFDRVLELYNKDLAILLETHGEQHPDVAKIYCNMAVAYQGKGELDRALGYFMKALAIQLVAHGDKHATTGATFYYIATVHKMRGELDKALEFYGKSLVAQLATVGDMHPDLAATYNNMAIVHHNKGDIDLALELYQKTLQVQLAALGEKHVDTATTFYNIGIVWETKGLLDRALENYAKALQIRLATLGEKHLETGKTFNNVAIMHKQRHEYDQAFECFNRALVIQLSTLGDKNIEVSKTYNNLAYIYETKGDLTRALDNYHKALTIQLHVLGDRHAETARTYGNIAIVSKNKGDADAALKFYTKALEIQVATIGEQHPDTAKTYNNMANIYKARNQLDQALDLYSKALRIRQASLGENHADTATAYNNLGNVFNSKGDVDRALEHYTRALAIQLSTIGAQHPQVAATYNNMAVVHESKGELDKALEYYSEALAIRLDTFHPDTALTYSNMANVYKNKGDYVKALDLYNKTLSLRTAMLGEKHPDVAATYRDLGLVYEMQGQYADALKYYQTAHAIVPRYAHDIECAEQSLMAPTEPVEEEGWCCFM